MLRVLMALGFAAVSAGAVDFEAANRPTPEYRELQASFENPAEGWTPLFNGKDLSGWHPQDYSPRPPRPWDWTVPALAAVDPADETRLVHAPYGGSGAPAVVANREGKSANLVTDQEYADVELYIEFMLSRKTNAGVCLMGNYEIQLYDSVGVANQDLTVSDNGAIYAFPGKKGRFGGSPPRVNASRGPGEWQSLHVWFRAPRFGPDGKKIVNARFLRVELNGVEIQRNYELLYSTRAVPPWEERAKAPLLLQGDHGPVAFRNAFIRDLREMAPEPEDSLP